jgi:hypothetical protein
MEIEKHKLNVHFPYFVAPFISLPDSAATVFVSALAIKLNSTTGSLF